MASAAGGELTSLIRHRRLTSRNISKIRAKGTSVTRSRYRWAAPGDVNSFFGLMLDNIADLLLMVGLLYTSCGFPVTFSLQHLVPGTAIGVFVGDLLFFWLAFRLARRTGRTDVTAMPLGLDTPSTIGMVFFVLSDAYRTGISDGLMANDAARLAWHIGICSIFFSGIFKLVCTLASGWVRRLVPRAGLLGSLAAIALVLISFLPLVDVLHAPLVGFVALAIILTSLTARLHLPLRIPGALGALVVASVIYYLMRGFGLMEVEPLGFDPRDGLLPTGWWDAFKFEWLQAIPRSIHYLPIVIPFALATVVGGIDCTESAAAAGDEYDTRTIIGVEAVATLVAALCGGVIQSTPYIGHPAYKAMGGRAAYTLATALFVGGAGVLGYFSYLYLIIPKAAVFPILIFIGLEITSQSYLATSRRHYPALALATVPALAKLVMIYVGAIVPLLSQPLAKLDPHLASTLQTVHMISAGFIVTSLLWSSALANLIDRRLRRAAIWFGIGAFFSLFGVIHSPFPDEKMFLPFTLAGENGLWFVPIDLSSLNLAPGQTPYEVAAAYLLVAVLLCLWWWLVRPMPIEGDDNVGTHT